MPEFKDRLEQALTMRNMKPVELARLTGIGEGAISQYRKGAYKATQRNLEKIAKVLDVSIPWLMGSDEETPALRIEGGPNRNIIKIAGRDGSFVERELSDDQVTLMKNMLDQLKPIDDESL